MSLTKTFKIQKFSLLSIKLESNKIKSHNNIEKLLRKKWIKLFNFSIFFLYGKLTTFQYVLILYKRMS